MKVKNPQVNDPVEWVRQVMYNVFVAKYFSNKSFNYIYSWRNILSYIAWVIRTSYHHTLKCTPGKYIFVRGMIFNLS